MMDFLFELIAEMFFGGAAEAVANSKENRKIRTISLLIITIPVLVIFGFVLYFAIKSFSSDIISGIVLSLVDLFILCITIYAITKNLHK